jgi:2-succinyl-5-enolpyruvyl-6-hydroxy-3-cyclohexene-1-carboxylate synthase
MEMDMRIAEKLNVFEQEALVAALREVAKDDPGARSALLALAARVERAKEIEIWRDANERSAYDDAYIAKYR